MNVVSKLVRSVSGPYAWSLAERFGAGAVSLVGNILLAGLLMPDDFGLVAMLGVFTSLVYALADCGMSDALLREPDPTRRDFSTMFFFNLAVGILICVLFVVLSPVVAGFYGRDELRAVMSCMGLGAVFSAMSIAPVTRLRHEMRFRRLALLNVGSITLSLALALALACSGGRYWALVVLQVGFSVCYWLLLVLTSGWRLGWEFDRERFGQMWRFGVNLLLATVVVQLSGNVVAMLMGRYHSVAQAGYMGQAQKLQQAPVSALENGVSSAAYVLMAKEATMRRQDGVFMAVFGKFTLALAASCALGIVLCRPLVALVFPERWLPVVPYLQMLLFWAMVYPLGSFMMTLLKLRDRTAVARDIVVAERAAAIAAAFFLHRWGVAAIIAAFIAISALALVAGMWQCSRVSTLRLSRLLSVYLSRLLPFAAMAALCC